MKLLFYLGHPAHFHLANSLANQLKATHEILFVARAKDVLLDLVKTTNIPTIVIAKKERGKSKFSLVTTVLKREFSLLKIYIKFKPDILLGTDIVITHIGKLFNKPSFIFNEDDEKIVPFLAKFGFKYATGVFSPISCIFDKYQSKKIEYDGFHKMTYLHPNYFNPNIEILVKNNIKTPFSLIRLSSLNAHHDDNIKGLSSEVIDNVINKLEKFGTVYISSENELPKSLMKYKLNINPKEIHHILFYAELLIADSQSMSVEASLLGTPNIRFSDFAGRIGVLKEIEEKYQLSLGVKTSQSTKLLKYIEQYTNVDDLGGVFSERRNKLVSDKIDTTAFFVWFINNFPKSFNIVKENPEYPNRFK